MLAIINANLVAMGSRKRAKRPEPYKRPGDKEAQNIKKYGKGALTVPELEAFFEQKRKHLHMAKRFADISRALGLGQTHHFFTAFRHDALELIVAYITGVIAPT